MLRPRAAARAAEILRAGGVVGIPTETVYGVAADATSDAACLKIYEAKGRARDNPLIVHVHNRRMLCRHTINHPAYLPLLLRRFTPGPLTFILHKGHRLSSVATCGLNTVAVRIPRNRLARRIIAAACCPLAAPSANASGRLSGTTAEMVRDALYGKIDAVVDGGATPIGVESTIVRAEAERVVVVRPGVVTAEMLRAALRGWVTVIDQTHRADADAVVPGQRYRHYRPQSRLWVSADLPHDVARALGDASLADASLAAPPDASSPADAPPAGRAIALVLRDTRPLALIRRAAQAGGHRVRFARVVCRVGRSGNRYRVILSSQSSAAQHTADTDVRTCYYYLARSDREYAHVFYSLCHFFDKHSTAVILCTIPTAQNGYAISMRNRLMRAKE